MSNLDKGKFLQQFAKAKARPQYSRKPKCGWCNSKKHLESKCPYKAVGIRGVMMEGPDGVETLIPL